MAIESKKLEIMAIESKNLGLLNPGPKNAFRRFLTDSRLPREQRRGPPANNWMKDLT